MQDFNYEPELKPYAVPEKVYLEHHKPSSFDYIATGAFVFDLSEMERPRVLLVQRAASDSMPDCWEVPGGGCQDTDDSILSAAARELWEEARLETESITHMLGKPHLFSSRKGKKICQFNFLITPKRDPSSGLQVKLNPQEHQKYVWATKENVIARQFGDMLMKFTSQFQEATIREAFDKI